MAAIKVTEIISKRETTEDFCCSFRLVKKGDLGGGKKELDTVLTTLCVCVRACAFHSFSIETKLEKNSYTLPSLLCGKSRKKELPRLSILMMCHICLDIFDHQMLY